MEKDLFLPIKSYFEGYGYTCDGEVNGIDLYMEKDNTSVAVELKINLDFKALQQAAQRQKLTDHVYIGIFRPKDINRSSFQDKLYLLKRLGIGLIVVSKRTKTVTIVSEPVVSELSTYQRQNKSNKAALEKEFQKRRTKSNIGGVHATKLITGYREDALLVLDAILELGGEGTGKDVARISGIKNARTIMYVNHYGWFYKKTKGLYAVSEEGLSAVEEFEDTIRLLKTDNQ